LSLLLGSVRVSAQSRPSDANEVAAWLNQLYTGFDENDDSSPLGVTISMQNEFALYCHTGCFHGQTDCRLSASVYNHKVQLKRSTGDIKVTMGRVAGIVLNQTGVETSFGKCSYMYDGATFNRYNNGCGCAAHSNACSDETSAFGNVCPTSGKSCTVSDPEVSRCACTNTKIPDRSDRTQCFFEGAAFGSGSEDQTRTMLKERLQRQDGSDSSNDPLEYWNEVVIDENVLMEQLAIDPVSVIPAMIYVKSRGAGLIYARKLRQGFADLYGEAALKIPLIAIDDEMVAHGVTGRGPFIATDELATQSTATQSVSV